MDLKFLTTTASTVSSVVVDVTASRAKFYVIACTTAPYLHCSCNAGSDGSDTLLAVLPAKSSGTSSTRCRLRTGAGSGVVG